MFASLMIMLVAMKSHFIVHANRPAQPPWAWWTQTAAAAQSASNGQVPPIKFGSAVFYGMTFSPSFIAVGDVNGDGKLDVVAVGIPSNGNLNSMVGIWLGKGDGTFRPSVIYNTGDEGANSVAIGDLNGDGKPDLVVGNSYGCATCDTSTLSVLLGNGDGTFQPPVNYSSGGSYVDSVAIADLNGDGIPDLVVANGYQCVGCLNGGVGVLLGNGDGTFQPAASFDSGGYFAASVVIADLNGDGKPDLAVANGAQCHGCGNSEVSVFLGNGDGTFQPPASYIWGMYGAASIAIADLNGDGKPDLAVAIATMNGNSVGEGEVSVLLGNGDGTFQTPVSYKSGGHIATSVAIADLNDDGHPDLAVANWCPSGDQFGDCYGYGKVGVLRGNGDGTFLAPKSYSTGALEGASVAIGDLKGDGQPDLLVANEYAGSSAGGVGVLLNKFTVTTTKLSSSLNPSLVNQTVTFTATITAIEPIPDNEVVAFYNGKTEIGTGTTMNGVAALNTSFSIADAYTIKASYAGDTSHEASTGRIKQVVNP
jgi:hypothetical protein